MDEENQKHQQLNNTKITHWQLVRDPSLLTPLVLTHTWKEGKGTSTNPYIVDFIPNPASPTSPTSSASYNSIDIRNPQNLPTRTRWFIAFLNAFATLVLTFASSAYTSSIPDLQRRLGGGVSSETAFLGTSLFVLGFAIGPLVWAPLSESFGRRKVFLGTYGLFVILNAIAALAADKSIVVIIVARGLGGMLGSSALVNSSSGTADLFSLADRGKVNAYFSAAPFLGPVLGPIVGGFLSQGAGGWMGVGGVITLLTAMTWMAYFFVVPETYAPVLLRLRAARLTRLSVGAANDDEDEDSDDINMRVYYQSRLDKAGGGPKTVAQMLQIAMIRPFRLLFSETIVMVLSVYMAIIFGAMYLMFAAFPIVFQSPQGYGFSQGVGGLAFLGIGVGMVLALLYMLFANKEYVRIAKASPGGKASPETRLLPARLGAVMAPMGLIVFAVTNSPEFYFLIPILGTVPFGFGMVVIFTSLLGYLVDTYTVYAASAIAAATAVRSVFGAVFPLFTRIMFTRLGVHFGAAIPAGLAALCLPFPFLFRIYGKQIREKAKFATEARNIAMKLAAGAAAAAAAAKAKASDEKKPPMEPETRVGQDEKERPLSEAHGPTAKGEWQCYGRYCLGCSVDEDNFFVCRNASLYEKKDWAMQ